VPHLKKWTKINGFFKRKELLYKIILATFVLKPYERVNFVMLKLLVQKVEDINNGNIFTLR
jgi:hypothetical protein